LAFEFGLVNTGGAIHQAVLHEERDSVVADIYDRPLWRPDSPAGNGQSQIIWTGSPLAEDGIPFYAWEVNPVQGITRVIGPTERARLARDLQFAHYTAQEAARDRAVLEQRNARIAARNARTYEALTASTGTIRPNDREEWTAWYLDVLGYRYDKAKKGMKPKPFQMGRRIADPPYLSCFAAGTPVVTLQGRRPIETLKVGDRVLAQNTITGTLSFQPILTVHHNPPMETLRLRLERDSIVPSTRHRFWKAGEGWVMARDLKSGDRIRTLVGSSVIESIQPEMTQPVYNLDVDTDATFFVGKAAAVVHDNRLPEFRAKGFDSHAESASAESSAHAH
jgi:hypothetical protein